MDDYQGPERRATLTHEQIEYIADRAAEKAIEKIYADLGRGAARRGLQVAGALGSAILAFLIGKYS